VDRGFGSCGTRGDGDLILGFKDQASASSSSLYDSIGDPLPLVTGEGEGGCCLAAGGPCGAKGSLWTPLQMNFNGCFLNLSV
jgi:hypothetical protein